jgi:hypothetical protein
LAGERPRRKRLLGVAGQFRYNQREEGAVKQAALEIGRKIVNRAVDRF